MPVADMAREFARRDLDAKPIAAWANVMLRRLGVPEAKLQAGHVDDLCEILRRVVEGQAVEYFTITELAALSARRFRRCRSPT